MSANGDVVALGDVTAISGDITASIGNVIVGGRIGVGGITSPTGMWTYRSATNGVRSIVYGNTPITISARAGTDQLWRRPHR